MQPGYAETLIARMPDALIHADSDGLIQAWNAGASRMFGHSASEAIGQSLDLIIPGTLRARHWLGYHETMRTGRTRYGEGQILSVPAVRKDGTRLSVAFTIVPFMDDAGRMTGIAAIMRDVTAQFEETRALRHEIAALKARMPVAEPSPAGIVSDETRTAILRVAFHHRISEANAEAGFERFRRLSGSNPTATVFHDALNRCVAGGLIHDPVRLPEGALQCHWRLELTAAGAIAAGS